MFAALVGAGCSRGDGDSARGDDTAQADTAATAEAAGAAAPTSAVAAGNPADAPMTAEDVDRYERGVRAEIEAAQKAVEDRKRAKSSADSLSAQFAALEQNTIEAGARAAGVSVDRYRTLNNTMNQVLGARQMGAVMQKQTKDMDTTNLTPEQRARVREGMAQANAAWGDPYKDLAPDVATVVKQRADQLDSLRQQLLKVRFQAAGIGTP